jgi:hypothetical protein
MDSLVGWLEALRAERINVENESSGIDLKTDGAVLAKTYVGTIVQLCQASADLCKHYESIALEIERMESIQQIGPAPNAEASTPKLRAKRKQQTAKFPQRAAWLRQRLAEREWDHNDPPKHRGPDRKTVLKILDGGDVRESVLESLAESLSKKHSNVGLLEIPRA